MGKGQGVPYYTPDRRVHVGYILARGDKVPPLAKVQLANLAIRQSCKIADLCVMCGIRIKTMAFKNEGVCSELCRKDRDSDHSKSYAIIEAPTGGERAI